MWRKGKLVAVAGLMIGSGATGVAAQEPATQLDDLVVTTTMTDRDSASTPAFSTIVTADDLARTAWNSLADALRETVGVNNMTDNSGRDEIQIRGLGGSYTLLLVDGKRVSTAGAMWRGGDFDLSMIPLGSIERVEIIRGPMAALYGSDAIGGIVNIITRKPTEQWQGSVGGEYRVIEAGDEGDQIRANAWVSGALSDRVSLSLGGQVLNRDPWYQHSADDPTEFPLLEEKKTTDLLSTLRFDVTDSQRIDLDLGYNRDKRPYSLYSYVYYPAYDYESFGYRAQKLERTSIGLQHEALWSWGKTVAYIKHEDGDIDDYNSSYDEPQQHALSEKNTYAKAYATGSWLGQGLTGGVEFRRQTIEDASTYLETGDAETDEKALFLQDEIALGEKLTLTLGGRLDDNDVFGSHFSPKGYLVYELNPAVTLKGGVGRAFKAPAAYQTSEQYSVISCGGSCYLSGNPDLDPETSTSYEVGMELRQDNWRASIAGFYNDVDDMIIAVYDASGPSREWSNVAKAKTRGIELDGEVQLASAWTLAGNLTVLHTEYTDSDGSTVKLENRPDKQANLHLDWQVTAQLSATANANYVGEQYYEGVDLPDYTRYDLYGSFQLVPGLKTNFGVKNLTDVNLDDKDENFVTHELGRNYYVGATWTFGA